MKTFCVSEDTPIQSEALQTPVVSVAQLHTFDVDPVADIIVTEGREAVAEIHVSPVTPDRTSLPRWPTNL